MLILMIVLPWLEGTSPVIGLGCGPPDIEPVGAVGTGCGVGPMGLGPGVGM